MRERLARIAVRLYPSPFRDDHGSELLGTLLDAGELSTAAFVTQLTSVLLASVAARCRTALAQPVRSLVPQTLVWAAVVSVALPFFYQTVMQLPHGVPTRPAPLLIGYIGPALILLLFTAGRGRAAGAIGVAWAIAGITLQLQSHPTVYASEGLRWILLPAVGFTVLLLAPHRALRRTRALDPARRSIRDLDVDRRPSRPAVAALPTPDLASAARALPRVRARSRTLLVEPRGMAPHPLRQPPEPLRARAAQYRPPHTPRPRRGQPTRARAIATAGVTPL